MKSPKDPQETPNPTFWTAAKDIFIFITLMQWMFMRIYKIPPRMWKWSFSHKFKQNTLHLLSVSHISRIKYFLDSSATQYYHGPVSGSFLLNVYVEQLQTLTSFLASPCDLMTEVMQLAGTKWCESACIPGFDQTLLH